MDEDHHALASSSENSPVNVYIRVAFTKIYDIDTLNQRFQAEAIVESKWHDPQVKSLQDDLGNSGSSGANKVIISWKPDLYVENSISDVKEEISLKVVYDEELNKLMVSEIRKVKGLFWENLELENFPCDIQDLSLILTSKKSSRHVNLILAQPELCDLKLNNTLERSMWHLHTMVKSEKEFITREYSFGKREYPSVRLTCQAFRLPEYFYWNLMLPILLITLAALGPFVIDFKMPQSRLPSTATMLLSSVSFKSVISRSLPTVSYLTSLDKYSLGSIAIITALLLYHALIAAFSHVLFGAEQSWAFYLDKVAFVFFFSLILLTNLIYARWLSRMKQYQINLRSKKIFHTTNFKQQQKQQQNDNETRKLKEN